MCYGKEDEEEKINKIKDLGWFAKGPIYGDDGPVLTVNFLRNDPRTKHIATEY